jgi:hypothetical protein
MILVYVDDIFFFSHDLKLVMDELGLESDWYPI